MTYSESPDPQFSGSFQNPSVAPHEAGAHSGGFGPPPPAAWPVQSVNSQEVEKPKSEGNSKFKVAALMAVAVVLITSLTGAFNWKNTQQSKIDLANEKVANLTKETESLKADLQVTQDNAAAAQKKIDAANSKITTLQAQLDASVPAEPKERLRASFDDLQSMLSQANDASDLNTIRDILRTQFDNKFDTLVGLNAKPEDMECKQVIANSGYLTTLILFAGAASTPDSFSSVKPKFVELQTNLNKLINPICGWQVG